MRSVQPTTGPEPRPGPLGRGYDALVNGIAAVAMATLVAMIVAIVVDVLLRNAGFRPFQATSALVEYALLFVTMAGGPWLVRRHGHVTITSFVAMAPPGLRKAIAQAVTVLAIATLGLLAWRATALGIEAHQRSIIDIRSIPIPRAVAFGFLAGGFALMAVEFLRLLLRGEPPGGTGGAA